MPKQLFIAAFLIDPAEYNPDENGAPVDKHFVVSHLAQSMGEEPGVSDFIVWDSAADFVLDHTECGPIDVAWLEGTDDAAEGRANG